MYVITYTASRICNLVQLETTDLIFYFLQVVERRHLFMQLPVQQLLTLLPEDAAKAA